MLTQGRIRNRLLLTIRCRCALRAEGNPMAQVMITFHQFPPQGPFLGRLHQREGNARVVTQSPFQRFAPGSTRGSIDVGFRAPWPSASPLWQINE